MGHRRTFFLAPFLLSFVLGPPAAPGQPERPPGRYALLVGCTKYANLPEKFSLEGPANDVALLRKVLCSLYHFADKDIVTLAEGAGGEDRRPTRKNIEREFRRLRDRVRDGDQVVILLSGHGSQQPDHEPFDEVDGLDETFLPADAGPWDGDAEVVRNALVDDELEVWARAITARGAFLWVIVDACHSGSALRSPTEVTQNRPEEMPREVPAKELMPEAVLKAARLRGEKRFGTERGLTPAPPYDLADSDHLVALYAALANQETLETNLPRDCRDAKQYGLLTYTLCQTLCQTQAGRINLTYRELRQFIAEQYYGSGRSYPTPVVEGKGQYLQVLVPDMRRHGRGEVPTDPAPQQPEGPHLRDLPRMTEGFRLQPRDEGSWKLEGGRLHGLTTGTILAVYPPLGKEGEEKVLGHVRITRARTLDAIVEPCEHDKMPAPTEIPAGAHGKPVWVDYGDLRLRLAVEPAGRAARADVQQRQRLEEELRKVGGQKQTLVEVVGEAGRADWLVDLHDGQAYLFSAHGITLREPSDRPPTLAQVAAGSLAETPVFGPYRVDDKLHELLRERLQRIARVELLERLAVNHAADMVRGSSSVDVALNILRFKNKEDEVGQVIQQGSGLTLSPGDRIAFRATNRSKTSAAYVTLLFIDSGYGIKVLYPRGWEAPERLAPGASFRTPTRSVTDDTVGLEHVVAIAVRATGNPLDFTCLAQPTLARARQIGKERSGGEGVLATPLGQLFENGLYGQGSTRGAEKVVIQSHALQLLSWKTLPGKGKK